MAYVRKNVALSFGLLSATVHVMSALEPKARNITVCTGAAGKTAHDPVRIHQKNTCDQCGDIAYHEIKKAREAPEGLVLLSAEDLTSVAADGQAYVQAVQLTPHPAEPVDQETVPGGKTYYLDPAPGNEQSYRVITTLVRDHPELAFMTKYTPRSSMGVYRVGVRDGALILQERVAGDNLVAAPTFNAVEVPPALQGMAEQVLALEGVIQDFDLSTYRDSTEDRIAALVASRTPVAEITTAPAAPGAPAKVQDGMAALAAMLAAAAPPAKKATPRKRTAKAS